MKPVALVDIDGTLMDSNYHHALAWFRALRTVDVTVPIWKLHRHVGMGGDHFVEAVGGAELEDRHGEALRKGWKREYSAMIDEVQPLPDARRLLQDLREAGWSVVLASSAEAEQTEHYLDVLDARELAHGWTTSADVESTKPEPDLLVAAIEKAEGADTVLIGDSIWDVEACKRVGIPCVCVLTGGFSAAELRDAGAAEVYESLQDLRDDLDALPLASRT